MRILWWYKSEIYKYYKISCWDWLDETTDRDIWLMMTYLRYLTLTTLPLSVVGDSWHDDRYWGWLNIRIMICISGGASLGRIMAWGQLDKYLGPLGRSGHCKMLCYLNLYFCQRVLCSTGTLCWVRNFSIFSRLSFCDILHYSWSLPGTDLALSSDCRSFLLVFIDEFVILRTIYKCPDNY